MSELMKASRFDPATCDTPYLYEVQGFLDFSRETSLPWGEAVKPFLDRFQTASTYNKNLAMIKRLVRDTIDLVDAPEAEKRRIETSLARLKTRKTSPGNVEDKVPTSAEVQILIGAADRRVSLMLRFLWDTGVRVR